MALGQPVVTNPMAQIRPKKATTANPKIAARLNLVRQLQQKLLQRRAMMAQVQQQQPPAMPGTPMPQEM